MAEKTRVWFVTDIHGSDVCFRKFLNSINSKKNPDVLILGGDITGKYIVPIVRDGAGPWRARFEAENAELDGENALSQYEQRLADRGAYGFRCDPALLAAYSSDETLQEQTAQKLRSARLIRWVELADRRMGNSTRTLVVNAGNDDPWYVDAILDQSRTIVRPEGKCLRLDNYVTMISSGYANATPWNCPRDFPEEVLRDRIDSMVSQVPDLSKCVFNLHVPPFGTILDRAPRLDAGLRPQMTGFGLEEESVGSVAVRDAIVKYQPCVGLHGHIHEQFSYVRLGRTLCFNPGSEYSQGTLRGVYLEFRGGVLQTYGLTRE